MYRPAANTRYWARTTTNHSPFHRKINRLTWWKTASACILLKVCLQAAKITFDRNPCSLSDRNGRLCKRIYRGTQTFIAWGYVKMRPSLYPVICNKLLLFPPHKLVFELRPNTWFSPSNCHIHQIYHICNKHWSSQYHHWTQPMECQMVKLEDSCN